MKKIILIAALVLVAVIGLTSFNGKEQHKEKGNSSLIAQLTGDGDNNTGLGNGGLPTGSGKRP
ncbi:hypothetical protein [Flavobacterium magnum]|uniref:hypothetical protein n=1 Tax=Flavobacterium magnum TaxID=2162713 RepID=UPI0011B235A2|nr:hypothetical protein [Flavobacterium magnum]